MSETKVADLSARPWPQLILGVLRGLARDRRALIGAGVLALVLGAAFNWSWLIAVGVAPVLLAVLPCAAMCALGLCAISMNHQPAGATTTPTGAAADGSAETQVREKVKGFLMTPDSSGPKSPIRPDPMNQASVRLTAAMRSSLAKALAAGEAERPYGRILSRRIDPPATLAVGVAAAPDETLSGCRSGEPWRSRRGVIGFLALAPLWALSRRAQADSGAGAPKLIELSPDDKRLLYDEIASKVVPQTGYQSRIFVRDSIVRCVRHGVIDLGKFFALQRDGERMPDDLSHVLSDPSDRPIRLTRENAGAYVNLLWAVGLANHMVGNFSSPLMGDSLQSFASTAGWTLGDRDEGADYFNKLPIVDLTPAQESLAIRVAKSTFRPCCDNSTFFQDCNHGSALYGLLQLGASQGLREADLYREALAFNSFWFEHHYVRTALYFAVERGVAWRDADPKEVMGRKYSSLSQWSETIEAWAERNPDLFPQAQGAGEPKLDLDPQSQGGAKCGA